MQRSTLNSTLLPSFQGTRNREKREEKIRRIKKLIKDDKFITHEKLDATLAYIFEAAART